MLPNRYSVGEQTSENSSWKRPGGEQNRTIRQVWQERGQPGGEPISELGSPHVFCSWPMTSQDERSSGRNDSTAYNYGYSRLIGACQLWFVWARSIWRSQNRCKHESEEWSKEKSDTVEEHKSICTTLQKLPESTARGSSWCYRDWFAASRELESSKRSGRKLVDFDTPRGLSLVWARTWAHGIVNSGCHRAFWEQSLPPY